MYFPKTTSVKDSKIFRYLYACLCTLNNKAKLQKTYSGFTGIEGIDRLLVLHSSAWCHGGHGRAGEKGMESLLRTGRRC